MWGHAGTVGLALAAGPSWHFFACIRVHSRFILFVLGSVAAEPLWVIMPWIVLEYLNEAARKQSWRQVPKAGFYTKLSKVAKGHDCFADFADFV